MRHASIRVTMNVFTDRRWASSKREANSKIVDMVLKPVQASAGNHDFSYWEVAGTTIQSLSC